MDRRLLSGMYFQVGNASRSVPCAGRCPNKPDTLGVSLHMLPLFGSLVFSWDNGRHVGTLRFAVGTIQGTPRRIRHEVHPAAADCFAALAQAGLPVEANM